MPYELFCFNGVENIIANKKMETEIKDTLDCIDVDLYGRNHINFLLKITLDYMGWRECENLNILEGHKYAWKGMRKGFALEANLKNYEWILEGLIRLQIGFDKGLIEAGLLLLDGKRSARSPLGKPSEIIQKDLIQLHPTISLPVCVALFDLGAPTISKPEQKMPSKAHS